MFCLVIVKFFAYLFKIVIDDLKKVIFLGLCVVYEKIVFYVTGWFFYALLS